MVENKISRNRILLELLSFAVMMVLFCMYLFFSDSKNMKWLSEVCFWTGVAIGGTGAIEAFKRFYKNRTAADEETLSMKERGEAD
jgi:hypothetical protein